MCISSNVSCVFIVIFPLRACPPLPIICPSHLSAQMCALMGMMVCPLSYLTVWELTQSNMAALLGGLIVLCETGTLVLSQYILLDPPLLFFIMAATFTTAKFVNSRDE